MPRDLAGVACDRRRRIDWNLPDTAPKPVARTGPKLGFLTNGSFSQYAHGGAAQGHNEAVELFRIAEQLGYDRGWIRNRHFDNYVTSPLTVLAAASQRTRRIGLGTAIIPMGYEHPIRLAEDAATVDLLSGGRLELGIASGIASFDRIFHGDGGPPWPVAAHRRIVDFVEALRGRSYGTTATGDDIHLRPVSPGLGQRLWYGAASPDSAARAAGLGLDLVLSAIAPDNGMEFGAAQMTILDAHRAAWTRTDRAPRFSTARTFFPALNDRQRALYHAYRDLRLAEGPAASRPAGALTPPDRHKPGSDTSAAGLMSPVIIGDPAAIVDYLLSDAAVAAAGELMIFLPPGFDHRDNLELIETIALHVAPHLGWAPAT